MVAPMPTEIKEYTPQYMAEAVYENASNENIDTMNGWLARGDSIAIYMNHDMSHPMLGHKIFLSFGSPVASLPEAPEHGSCPVDLGSLGLMHWRYYLDGTYSGPALEHYEESEDAS